MELKDFLQFGAFRLDPGRRQLLRDGQAISLPGKAFDVLLVLLQRPGETVTKDDLMKAVWPIRSWRKVTSPRRFLSCERRWEIPMDSP